MTYRPRVANNERTIFLNIGFVKRSPALRGPSECAMFSIPLNARRNAITFLLKKKSVIVPGHNQGSFFFSRTVI